MVFVDIVWVIKYKQLIRDSVPVHLPTVSHNIRLVPMDKNGASAQKPGKVLLQEVYHQVLEHIKQKLKHLILRSQDFSWVKKSRI